MENSLQIGPLELAYLGDSVFELMVRTRLIKSGYAGVGRLNRLSLEYVKATAQSKALENILPYLTETEEGVFKRARNNSRMSAPKSASALEYRRATGFEALFAYLYLEGQNERMNELFDLAFPPEN